MRLSRERKSSVWGMPTGFTGIDELTGGLHAGEVTICGARPSVGKSSLISQITFNVAFELVRQSEGLEHPFGKVLYFSPEMSPEDLICRQVAQIAEVPLTDIRAGRTDEATAAIVEDAARALAGYAPVLEMYAGMSLDINAIVERVTTANRTGPPVKLVAVDYLTRIDAGNLSEHSAANKLSRTFKNLALTEQTPILVGAQLSRKGDRERKDDDPESSFPHLTDLRDSGRIEEDADVVWLIHRENELRRSTEPTVQPATLIIAKNRNGPTGVVPLLFEPHLTRFQDGR